MTLWPSIVGSVDDPADPHPVIRAMLGALSLMCLLGLRHPLRMLPLLLFELAWKVLWVVLTALPRWHAGTLDTHGPETLFACLVGVVLAPLVAPWGHVGRHDLRGPGEAWRVARRAPWARARGRAAHAAPRRAAAPRRLRRRQRRRRMPRQSPPPQRCCQVTATASKSLPVRAYTPLLSATFTEFLRSTGSDSEAPTRQFCCRSRL